MSDEQEDLSLVRRALPVIQHFLLGVAITSALLLGFATANRSAKHKKQVAKERTPREMTSHEVISRVVVEQNEKADTEALAKTHSGPLQTPRAVEPETTQSADARGSQPTPNTVLADLSQISCREGQLVADAQQDEATGTPAKSGIQRLPAIMGRPSIPSTSAPDESSLAENQRPQFKAVSNSARSVSVPTPTTPEQITQSSLYPRSIQVELPQSYAATPRYVHPAPHVGQPTFVNSPDMFSVVQPQIVSGTNMGIVERHGYPFGTCRTCVDRNGVTCKEELDRGLGIGPCIMPDSQCWQCPYDEPFSRYGAGEYAGITRMAPLDEYRLRSGDVIQLRFLLTALRSREVYRLAVGDELLIEVEGDETLTRGSFERGLQIQPDGTITLRLIGQVQAAGQSVEQLQKMLVAQYGDYYTEPVVDVTPVSTGSAAKRVRDAIGGAGGFEAPVTTQTVTPGGQIRLPKIGSVHAQGLSLEELKQEINLRYDRLVGGIEVEPALEAQAAHNIFVVGEVNNPGRIDLENTPTTVVGAIALAGSYVPGANLRQIVIFRRGDNWELLSTMVDLRGALLGREAHPADEIWLRDGDIVIVPSSPIRLFNNFVDQVFVRGIYGVFPLTAAYNFGGSF